MKDNKKLPKNIVTLTSKIIKFIEITESRKATNDVYKDVVNVKGSGKDARE